MASRPDIPSAQNAAGPGGPRSACTVPEAALDVQHRRPGDRIVVSVHWGPNWGDRITADQRAFARRLVEVGAALEVGWFEAEPA